MLTIKNLHSGILIVRLARGQVLELQPDAIKMIPEDEILNSQKAMHLVESNKLKIFHA